MAQRENVTSSNIAAIGYDASKNEMEVEFKSGQVFLYEGVSPDEHQDLMNAPSIGKKFNQDIKNGDYKFKNITT